MPLNGEFRSLCHRSIEWMPRDCKLPNPQCKPCNPDVCPPLRSLRTASSHTGQTDASHRSDRSYALWINHRTQWVSGEPTETPWTRCSLRQSPLMTRIPCGPNSTLVLRLNQETVHDFIVREFGKNTYTLETSNCQNPRNRLANQ
jgi:hypothetical protein